jgi:hypothetical protein
MGTQKMALSSIELSPSTRGFGRFERLLARTAAERPLYDSVLFEHAGCVVAPTLGSILPRWLLIVPRVPCANFRSWYSLTGINPTDLIAAVLSRCCVDPHEAIWFEHGAVEARSAVACGVDHAHLHLLLKPAFSLEELLAAANNNVALDWNHLQADQAYASADPCASYVLGGSGTAAAYSRHIERVGSQYLRKAVAVLAGCPETWDYKVYPHLQQVQATVDFVQPRQRQ